MMISRIGLFAFVVAAMSAIAAAGFMVPDEYHDRLQATAVVKEFRQMFDSVFGPINERPYREDVFSLLISMDKFLSQSYDLINALEQKEVAEVEYYAGFIKKKTDQGIKYIRNLKNLPRDQIVAMYHRHVDWIKNGFITLERNQGYYLAGVGKTALEQYLEPAMRDFGEPLRQIGQALTCPNALATNYGPPPMMKYGFAQPSGFGSGFGPGYGVSNCPACQINNKPPSYH